MQRRMLIIAGIANESTANTVTDRLGASRRTISRYKTNIQMLVIMRRQQQQTQQQQKAREMPQLSVRGLRNRAAGRAAVADGQAFKVQGSGDVALLIRISSRLNNICIDWRHIQVCRVYSCFAGVASVNLNTLHSMGSYGLLAASIHPNTIRACWS